MVQLRKWQPLLKLDGAQSSYRQIVEGLVAAISEGRLRLARRCRARGKWRNC